MINTSIFVSSFVATVLILVIWFIGQKIAIKKWVSPKETPMPDAGVYRTATTFKEPTPITKGVAGVKMREPMQYSTKRAIAIVCNCLFISAMVMTAGMFWGMMSGPLAFASITAIAILSSGSLLTSKSLLE